ncbi:MAG: hypothetical protein HC890_00285 [Chloroflexaceae bacterium]|nr:hypothetical protein [Chloroflexaceae bacterium]
MAIAARAAAQASLKEALKKEGGDGDVHRATIAAAIDALCQLNPTPAPTRCPELLEGQWRLLSTPNFPQGQRLPGV